MPIPVRPVRAVHIGQSCEGPIGRAARTVDEDVEREADRVVAAVRQPDQVADDTEVRVRDAAPVVVPGHARVVAERVVPDQHIRERVATRREANRGRPILHVLAVPRRIEPVVLDLQSVERRTCVLNEDVVELAVVELRVLDGDVRPAEEKHALEVIRRVADPEIVERRPVDRDVRVRLFRR